MSLTKLKFIALFFMTIDHIGNYIPNMPIVLHWMGRLSAPIFFFCCAWSIDYTSNLKKYLFRLYLASVGMSIINYFTTIPSNIFRTLFLFVMIIYLSKITKGNLKKRILYYLLFITWQIIVITIVVLLLSTDFFDINLILTIIISLCGLCIELEGGFIIILGIGMYLFKKNKNKFIYFYLSFCTIYVIVVVTNLFPRVITILSSSNLIPSIFSDIAFNIVFSVLGFSPFYTDINLRYLFTIDYQWMMIFALPIILLYQSENDIKVHSSSKLLKYFFYIYYPLHLIVLNFIGQLL